MDTSKKEEKIIETYKLPCSGCKKKREFKPLLLSRKTGMKLECLTCGKIVHKNLKYLEGKKNESV